MPMFDCTRLALDINASEVRVKAIQFGQNLTKRYVYTELVGY